MKLLVGKGSCGLAAGAKEIFEQLTAAAAQMPDVRVVSVGCIGLCAREPLVEFVDDEGRREIYGNVTPDAAAEILKALQGKDNKAAQYALPQEDKDALAAQTRIALANCGKIDPEAPGDYTDNRGYEGARTCLTARTPEQVIEEIKLSGLRGRGGAGFPTWFKWDAARKAPGKKKYIICNADEGDPGAFMDRAVIEGDPHALLEGMLIAAYAIGSDEGIVYVRAEYPLAIQRLEKAIQDAREGGYLGQNIMGSGFSFDVRIKAGAGAFVCGEETALIASLEGERGMPKLKPPFPAQKGYWQQPSNINNVETYANVPYIIREGGAAYAALGTETAKGTKVFALTGKIAKGGLVEIPMGQTIRQVIYGPGGGIKNGKAFKAVQMGGPSGGCIPASLIDTPIDYQSLAATGAIMGSGGMVVMDEDTCMVDIARFFLDFTCKESCGKCTHCRVGNRRMLEILERICSGEGQEGDIELLSGLAVDIRDGSLCALGQTAPNPVLTTIRYFREEYEDHILRKKCTAGQCRALLRYRIDPDRCTGCTLCAKKCPAEAITGERKSARTIDQAKCIQCGKCAQVCRFSAVTAE